MGPQSASLFPISLISSKHRKGPQSCLHPKPEGLLVNIEATPSFSISLKRRPGAQDSSPGALWARQGGGVPVVITLLDRVIRPCPGWYQENSPSHTFLGSLTAPDPRSPTHVLPSSHEGCVCLCVCVHTHDRARACTCTDFGMARCDYFEFCVSRVCVYSHCLGVFTQ